MPGPSGCPSGTSTGCCCVGEHYGAPYDLLAARAARGAGPAARDHGAVAPRRVRRHRPARPRAGVVLADPGRDDRHRAGVPGRPGPRWAGWRTCGRSWPPGCGCRPAPAWQHGPGVVAFASGGCAPTSPAAGRREHVADAEIHWPSLDAQPVRRAGVGDRGGADPQARSRGPPGSWPGCCPRCGTRR